MNIFLKFKFDFIFIFFIIFLLYFNRKSQSKENEKIKYFTLTKNQIYDIDNQHKTWFNANRIKNFETKQYCRNRIENEIIKEYYLVENNIKKFNDIKITK